MRLNKRGKRARAIVITALVIALIYALSALIWWNGAGFCIGTMSECIDL